MNMLIKLGIELSGPNIGSGASIISSTLSLISSTSLPSCTTYPVVPTLSVYENTPTQTKISRAERTTTNGLSLFFIF
ncbi:hypothetical protein HN841_00385 [archaeon]|nr:hypothetical protein [archaeon]